MVNFTLYKTWNVIHLESMSKVWVFLYIQNNCICNEIQISHILDHDVTESASLWVFETVKFILNKIFYKYSTNHQILVVKSLKHWIDFCLPLCVCVCVCVYIYDIWGQHLRVMSFIILGVWGDAFSLNPHESDHLRCAGWCNTIYICTYFITEIYCQYAKWRQKKKKIGRQKQKMFGEAMFREAMSGWVGGFCFLYKFVLEYLKKKII
jgi:hypothetical protein